MDNRPPRERGGSVWQIFTLEQLKSHSWNIRLEPPTHRSVGRLSALYHRLLLQLCKLRHNSPPQDRLHRSKVATLARANAQYTAPPTIRTIHTVAISLVFPSKMAYNHDLQGWRHFIQSTLANRLGWSSNSPRHEQNETPARPLPHYGKIRKTEFFKWGFVFSPTL